MKCLKEQEAVCRGACRPNKDNVFKNVIFQTSLLVITMLLLLGLFIGLITNWMDLSDHLLSVSAIESVFTWITQLSILPVIIIAIPLFGGIGQLLFSHRTCHSRDLVVIFMAFITFILVMLTYPMAQAGGLDLSIARLLGLGISFHIDMLGFTMLMITSVIWFLVMVYAHEYMKKEQRCNRFFFFMAITYSAVLGTIMAGDLLTMFLFFEIMTFASYMLVTHGQQEESYQAGYNYIFMGLIGGFAILVALLLVYFTIGDVSFVSALGRLNEVGSIRYWIIGLLIFGFGIKAGMAPVHVWLPRAHPVAPTPASALLSGIMIKVGAYGILRVATSYFFPTTGAFTDRFDPVWSTSETIGMAVIWLGIITMAIGVFLALQQANIKRMLAYHSISQMGYIIMGIGVALYLGYWGAMGFAGALYHIVNHALFKSLLFMVAGVVYYHTKESDMYKLGGLWRKLPLTATVCLIAAFGICGIPLFNGFISKSILHHGIVEAYQYGHAMFYYAELIFIVISAGTVCSFIKLFYYVFLRKMPEKYQAIKPEYNCLDTSLVAVALIIIFIGLNPRIILDYFIIPQLYATNYDPEFISKYVLGLSFFTRPDLFITLVVVLLGGFIFIAGSKYHLFHLRLPGWLKIEYIFFYPINLIMRGVCRLMYGEQCPIDPETMARMRLKGNHKIGFLERFVTMTQVFNRRYESTIIKSDAFIYTVFITGILLFMVLVSLL